MDWNQINIHCWIESCVLLVARPSASPVAVLLRSDPGGRTEATVLWRGNCAETGRYGELHIHFQEHFALLERTDSRELAIGQAAHGWDFSKYSEYRTNLQVHILNIFKNSRWMLCRITELKGKLINVLCCRPPGDSRSEHIPALCSMA